MPRTVLVLAVIAGCLAQSAVADQSAAIPTGNDDTCGAAGFAGLIGQSGEIARMLELDQMVRVLGPGDPMTMDYRPDRINFMLDEDGRIVRIQCV